MDLHQERILSTIWEDFSKISFTIKKCICISLRNVMREGTEAPFGEIFQKFHSQSKSMYHYGPLPGTDSEHHWAKKRRKLKNTFYKQKGS